MEKAKQINIKNQINLKDFDAKLLKIDKKRLQRYWQLLHQSCVLKKLIIVELLTV